MTTTERCHGNHPTLPWQCLPGDHGKLEFKHCVIFEIVFIMLFLRAILENIFVILH